MSLFMSMNIELFFLLSILMMIAIMLNKSSLSPSLNNLMKTTLFSGFQGFKSIKSFKGENSFILSVFSMILLFNLSGVTPFTFSFSTQIHLMFLLSSMIFFALYLVTWTQQLSSFVTHFVEKDTPIMLISFIALIESLSWFSRPFILCLRLSANMIIGQVLMLMTSSVWFPYFFLSIFLTFFESFVSLIQALVFCLLLLNYKSEAQN